MKVTPITLVVLMAAAAAGQSCGMGTQSQYRPRNSSEVYFVWDKGAMQLAKGGRTHAVYAEDVPEKVFSCRKEAAAHAREAVSDQATAAALAPLATGLLPAFLIRKYRLDAMANLVDAVNIHNDSPGCTESKEGI